MMPRSYFETDDISVLFEAQRRLLEHMAASYKITPEVKAKTAKVIMHIGRNKRQDGGEFEAEGIAIEALFAMMTLSDRSDAAGVDQH